jgi:uncharacterized protein YjbI with pentapeptide repeats
LVTSRQLSLRSSGGPFSSIGTILQVQEEEVFVDPTIVAAIIGAIATTLAAIIAVRWARKPQESQPDMERYTQAIARLSDERLEIRLDGIYALEEKAKDPEVHWPIMEVLTNFVRERSPSKRDRESRDLSPAALSPDIHATLKVLGRRTLFYGHGEEQRLDLTKTDLRHADLAGAHLEGVDLRDADLGGTRLDETRLEGADLRGAYLREAVLDGAYLQGADLRRSHLIETSFRGARLGSVDFRRATFREFVLSGEDANHADFSETNLSEANLSNTNFSGAVFRGANLSGADLSGALFPNADLIEADLSNANLSNADLSGAILSSAALVTANLTGANLTDASLITANVSDAALREAKLSGADFLRANLTNANLSGADLTAARVVETNLDGAYLQDCLVYGISAWDLRLSNTHQANLTISPPGESAATVDDISLAQVAYLLSRDTKKLLSLVEMMRSKAVLVLGSFTPERKTVLAAIVKQIHDLGYLPMLISNMMPPVYPSPS